MASKVNQVLDQIQAKLDVLFPGITYARGEGAIKSALPHPRVTWVRVSDQITTGPRKNGTNPRVRALARCTVVAHLAAADDTLEALEHALVLACVDLGSAAIEFGDAEWTTATNLNAEAVLVPLIIPVPITMQADAEVQPTDVGTDAPAPVDEDPYTLHCGDP